MSDDPTELGKLDELLTTLRACDDPRRAAAEWKQVYKLLGQAGMASGRVSAVVGMRDVAGLAEAIEQLRSPAGVAEDAPDDEVLKAALHAFRKRLSLTVLDDESKLGRGPLSKGGSGMAATITPPVEWPDAVWQELVRQGRIRYVGHGLYGLGEE